MNFDWLSGPHAPYILSAYAIALAVCLYVALAPVLNGKRQRRQIASAHRNQTLHAQHRGNN